MDGRGRNNNNNQNNNNNSNSIIKTIAATMTWTPTLPSYKQKKNSKRITSMARIIREPQYIFRTIAGRFVINRWELQFFEPSSQANAFRTWNKNSTQKKKQSHLLWMDSLRCATDYKPSVWFFLCVLWSSSELALLNWKFYWAHKWFSSTKSN